MATGILGPDTVPAHGHDAAYVNVSGDEMTGGLTVTTATDDGLTLNDPNGFADLRFQKNRVDQWTLLANPSGDLFLQGGSGYLGQTWMQDGSADLSGGLRANMEMLDSDTQIAGQHDADLLRLDANVDRVGIGTATPQTKLDVRGAVTINTTLQAPSLDINSTAADCWIALDNDTAGGKEYLLVSGGTGGGYPGSFYIYQQQSGQVPLLVNAANAVTLLGLTGTGSRMVEASATGALSAAKVPGVDFISYTPFTSVASVTLPANTFTTAYRRYLLLIEITGSTTGNAYIYFQMKAGATVEGSANYYNAGQAIPSTGATALVQGSAATNISILWPQTSATSHIASGFLYVNLPAQANKTGFNWEFFDHRAGVDNVGFMGNAGLFTDTVYDTLVWQMTTGTMTGAIAVYGMRTA
jgi:hypothetical protein